MREGIKILQQMYDSAPEPLRQKSRCCGMRGTIKRPCFMVSMDIREKLKRGGGYQKTFKGIKIYSTPLLPLANARLM